MYNIIKNKEEYERIPANRVDVNKKKETKEKHTIIQKQTIFALLDMQLWIIKDIY